MLFRDDFPIVPRKFPFFYGWVIVIAGALGTLASIPGQTMGVSVFTDHLMDALGLSRTQLSLAYMFGTTCSGLMMLRGGRLLDRFGVRRMLLVATTGLGLGLLGMSVIGRVTDAVASRVGDSATEVAAFSLAFLAFYCIRFFGQGLLAMIPRVMVGRWFERRRGLAIGLSGLCVSFGFGTAPVVLQKLIDLSSWTGAYAILGAAVGGGMGLIGWVFYRERPEDCGLIRDGRHYEADSSGNAESPFAARRDYTVEEARRTYVFWCYNLCLSCQSLIVTGVTFHIVSLSENAGLRAEEGLALFLPMACVSVATNFTAGWISDKIRLKYILITMMAAQLLGSCALLFVGDVAGRVMLVLGYGMSGGMFGTLVGTAWPRFFGTTHLGAISGLNMSTMVIGSAIGPILFGYFFEQTGTYTVGYGVSIAMSLSLFIAATRANNPQLDR